MEQLKGKAVIITGASRGIGRAIAESLAKEGVNLVIAARGREILEATAAEIAKAYGVKVLAVPCDVSKQADLENLVKVSIKEYKKIDALINNAGVSSQYPFHQQPLEDIEKLMYTNYFGYVMLTRLIINHFVENKGGAVINMVSGSTMVDPPPRNFIVYTSLKWALRKFGKGLFWEMRDYGIKVTSLLPGVTDTELTGKLKDVSEDRGRLMSTEAIENAVKFALTVPANVCPLEISVINQQTPWTKPVIPLKQNHPVK
ncbi:MAG: SDR family oxidoreductase [Candidatus Omnitrophota bacterium]|jgi:short-subunit dehydrogenase|nr:SDR family NAD(P)-dependent oxidoreductase [Candidatus Omnitrophota bacterium]MDD5137830.1 SDR family NAD(P)-dependent oxidoreductase [Candidatus Omnitrophota bacterium]MDD5538292.1 SDR family NAD(P)-dependent oxidoreductase [Candidatus Omnitrophota bacterium]